MITRSFSQSARQSSRPNGVYDLRQTSHILSVAHKIRYRNDKPTVIDINSAAAMIVHRDAVVDYVECHRFDVSPRSAQRREAGPQVGKSDETVADDNGRLLQERGQIDIGGGRRDVCGGAHAVAILDSLHILASDADGIAPLEDFFSTE